MSFYFPESAIELTSGTSGAVKLSTPAGAFAKPANTPFTLFTFIQTPVPLEGSFARVFLSRASGATSGNDARWRIDSVAATSITVEYRVTGTGLVFGATVSGLTPGKTYCVGIIGDSTNSWLFACAPGESPIIVAAGNTSLWALNASTVQLIDNLGGATGTVRPFYGAMEELCLFTGGFPLVSGSPDPTLLTAIASGTQDIATLATLMTSGVLVRRYRLRNVLDLADISASPAASLTKVNVDPVTKKEPHTGGTLYCRNIKPTRSRTMLSHAYFSVQGDTSNARADIRTETGVYQGVTGTAIQCRLVGHKTGTVFVDWLTVSSPVAGAWTVGAFPNVLWGTEWLVPEFRMVNGAGAQQGESAYGTGMRGVGINAVFVAQSQGQILQTDPGGYAIPDSLEFQTNTVGNSGAFSQRINKTNSTSRISRGMRQCAMEIGYRYPGALICFNFVWQEGTGLIQWGPGGTMVGRWAALATHVVVPQPYVLFMYGHVNNADGTYETQITNAVSEAEAVLGPRILDIQALTARYSGAGTGSNYNVCAASRLGQRNRVAANPDGKSRLAGSFHNIATSEVGTDPHPFDGPYGTGRAGTQFALAILSHMNAAPYKPQELKSLARLPSQNIIELTFGDV